MSKMLKKLIALLAVAGLLISCAACGSTHTHSYTAQGSDADNHWNYCPEDNEKDASSVEAHVDDNADGLCDVCGYEVGIPHTHSYTAWGYDENSHWMYCPEDNARDSSTAGAHADGDSDGLCDSCGYDMSTVEDTEATVTAISVEELEGKLYLIAKGTYTGSIPCIKIHADGNGVHYYGDNVATEEGTFELRFDLTQVPVEDTPWLWFHIYAYNDAAPSDPAAYDVKVDLMRESFLADDASWDFNGVRYSIISGDSAYGLVVIQPKAIEEVAEEMAISSAAVEEIDGKLYLVVKGVMPSDVACIKLQADADNVGYYGHNVSTEAGKFELRFDLTQVPAESKPWMWFHIYVYADAEPADLAAPATKIDLKNDGLLTEGTCWDFNGVRYTVEPVASTWGLVVIQAEVIKSDEGNENDPENVTVQTVTVEEIDGKLYLVVKGVMPSSVACIKAHADGNGAHYYGDNVSTEANAFELRFELSQVSAEGTPWLWFHIYVYADAEPADLSAYAEKIDLMNNDYLGEGTYWDCNGVRYSTITSGNYDMVVIQPTAAPVETGAYEQFMTLVTTMPSVDDVSLEDKATFDLLVELYGQMTDEQKQDETVLYVLAQASAYTAKFSQLTLEKVGLTHVSQTAGYISAELKDNCLYIEDDDAKNGQSNYFGSFFIDNENPVEGNFVLEMTFKVTSVYNNDTTRLLGLVFDYGTDSNGNGYGYAATIRINGKTCVTGYSVHEGKTSPTFKDQSSVSGSNIMDQVVTLRLAVVDGYAYVYLVSEDGTVSDRGSYDLSKIALADGLIADGETTLTGGKVGILISSENVEIYDISVYDYEKWVVDNLIPSIDALPEIGELTLAYKDTVTALATQFGALSEESQAKVTNAAKLAAAVEKLQAMIPVVTSVTVEEIDGKLYVVAKGTVSADVACLKIHADGNGAHYYGDNVSTEAGAFELRFDLTQVSVDGTPWLWFHIYIYDDAAPTDLAAYAGKVDLMNEDYLAAGSTWDCNGVRYYVITSSNYGMVVIQPKPIEE